MLPLKKTHKLSIENQIKHYNLPLYERFLASSSPMPDVAPVIIITEPFRSFVHLHRFHMINRL